MTLRPLPGCEQPAIPRIKAKEKDAQSVQAILLLEILIGSRFFLSSVARTRHSGESRNPEFPYGAENHANEGFSLSLHQLPRVSQCPFSIGENDFAGFTWHRLNFKTENPWITFLKVANPD